MYLHLQTFIATYGYVAVFFGSIFDGEVVMLLSGFLSRIDYLSFPWIIFWAFLGVMTNDVFWFLLGRFKGQKILHSYKWFKKYLGKPVAFVGKKPALMSFLTRFMYGFRHIVPFSIGISEIKTKTFFIYNFAGAVVWIIAYGGLGYLLGNVLESFLGKLHRFELLLVVVIVSFFIVVHVISYIIKKIFKGVVDKNLERET